MALSRKILARSRAFLFGAWPKRANKEVYRIRRILMPTGIVKWFNAAKGYGFIQPEAGGGDVFVHISAVERSGLRELQDGQKVSYEIQQDRKTGKSTAIDLRLG
jgi:cold shock protein